MSLCSLDTNILLYAANEDAPEHAVCKKFLQWVVDSPAEWVIADQVYFELYVALRNPKVMTNPLAATEAADHVSLLRNEMGIMHCSYGPGCWQEAWKNLRAGDFPFRRTHDAVLAATLLAQGVKTFYTRNTKDFLSSGIPKVINPVDSV